MTGSAGNAGGYVPPHQRPLTYAAERMPFLKRQPPRISTAPLVMQKQPDHASIPIGEIPDSVQQTGPKNCTPFGVMCWLLVVGIVALGAGFGIGYPVGSAVEAAKVEDDVSCDLLVGDEVPQYPSQADLVAASTKINLPGRTSYTAPFLKGQKFKLLAKHACKRQRNVGNELLQSKLSTQIKIKPYQRCAAYQRETPVVFSQFCAIAIYPTLINTYDMADIWKPACDAALNEGSMKTAPAGTYTQTTIDGTHSIKDIDPTIDLSQYKDSVITMCLDTLDYDNLVDKNLFAGDNTPTYKVSTGLGASLAHTSGLQEVTTDIEAKILRTGVIVKNSQVKDVLSKTGALQSLTSATGSTNARPVITELPQGSEIAGRRMDTVTASNQLTVNTKIPTLPICPTGTPSLSYKLNRVVISTSETNVKHAAKNLQDTSNNDLLKSNIIDHQIYKLTKAEVETLLASGSATDLSTLCSDIFNTETITNDYYVAMVQTVVPGSQEVRLNSGCLQFSISEKGFQATMAAYVARSTCSQTATMTGLMNSIYGTDNDGLRTMGTSAQIEATAQVLLNVQISSGTGATLTSFDSAVTALTTIDEMQSIATYVAKTVITAQFSQVVTLRTMPLLFKKITACTGDNYALLIAMSALQKDAFLNSGSASFSLYIDPTTNTFVAASTTSALTYTVTIKDVFDEYDDTNANINQALVADGYKRSDEALLGSTQYTSLFPTALGTETCTATGTSPITLPAAVTDELKQKSRSHYQITDSTVGTKKSKIVPDTVTKSDSPICGLPEGPQTSSFINQQCSTPVQSQCTSPKSCDGNKAEVTKASDQSALAALNKQGFQESSFNPTQSPSLLQMARGIPLCTIADTQNDDCYHQCTEDAHCMFAQSVDGKYQGKCKNNKCSACASGDLFDGTSKYFKTAMDIRCELSGQLAGAFVSSKCSIDYIYGNNPDTGTSFSSVLVDGNLESSSLVCTASNPTCSTAGCISCTTHDDCAVDGVGTASLTKPYCSDRNREFDATLNNMMTSEDYVKTGYITTSNGKGPLPTAATGQCTPCTDDTFCQYVALAGHSSKCSFADADVPTSMTSHYGYPAGTCYNEPPTCLPTELSGVTGDTYCQTKGEVCENGLACLRCDTTGTNHRCTAVAPTCPTDGTDSIKTKNLQCRTSGCQGGSCKRCDPQTSKCTRESISCSTSAIATFATTHRANDIVDHKITTTTTPTEFCRRIQYHGYGDNACNGNACNSCNADDKCVYVSGDSPSPSAPPSTPPSAPPSTPPSTPPSAPPAAPPATPPTIPATE
jgi:hypothetical protein